MILSPGQVTELRILDATTTSDRRPHTVSGYFDDVRKAADALNQLTSAKGIYFTPNPVNPALKSRACNRIRAAGKNPTTSDTDIIRRNWLLIDLDAERPAGISATDAEHAAAIELAFRIRAELSAEGFPEPIVADSGNGAHLMYRIDSPVDDGGIVERGLAALAERFKTDEIHVDTTVHNPARIWKLYGTLACKGDDTTDRPHRMAKLLEVPEVLAVVPEVLLTALADKSTTSTTTTSTTTTSNGSTFSAATWIEQHLPEAHGPKEHNGDKVWTLPVCRWNEAHTNDSAFIIQRANGVIGAGCKHNGCAGKGWHDLRDVVEPGWREQRKATTTSKPKAAIRHEPLPKWVPFPTDALPEPARKFTREAARAIGCDESYIALPLLAALAASIGTTRTIRLKRSWSEPCILWLLIAGPSGTLKSPAIDAPMKTLRKLQAEALENHAERMHEYEQAMALYAADKKAFETKGRKNNEPAPEKPVEPICQRYIVSDVTVEALADRLQHSPRGLLVVRDELSGWLQSRDQYKGGKGGDTSHWLTMHGARALIVDRKNAGRRPIYVPHAGVSVCGGIQPEIIERCIGRQDFENGMAARLLLAMPPIRAKRWTDDDISETVEKQLADAIEKLLTLDHADDKDGQKTPKPIPLSPEAKAEWIAFYQQHAAEQAELTGDLAAAWSKLEGYAARLALVVHLTRWAGDDTTVNVDLIDIDSIRAGVVLSRWFAGETRRVYGAMGESDDARDQRRLVELIERKGGTITSRELQAGCRWLRESGAAEAALEALAKAGWGSWQTTSSTPQGGRPSRIFTLSALSTVNETPTTPEQSEGFVDADTVGASETDLDDINAELSGTPDMEVSEWES